jgi:hypothetical protein
VALVKPHAEYGGLGFPGFMTERRVFTVGVRFGSEEA